MQHRPLRFPCIAVRVGCKEYFPESIRLGIQNASWHGQKIQSHNKQWTHQRYYCWNSLLINPHLFNPWREREWEMGKLNENNSPIEYISWSLIDPTKQVNQNVSTTLSYNDGCLKPEEPLTTLISSRCVGVYSDSFCITDNPFAEIRRRNKFFHSFLCGVSGEVFPLSLRENFLFRCSMECGRV